MGTTAQQIPADIDRSAQARVAMNYANFQSTTNMGKVQQNAIRQMYNLTFEGSKYTRIER